MTYDSQATQSKISAFLARKAEQHPDIFSEQEDIVSPADVLELQVAYA